MQKILKPILLLMIGLVLCTLPMLGYYSMGESWYAALCQVKGLPIIALPMMIYTIFANGGWLAAMKYGTIMITTGICATQYRRLCTNYNPYITAFIATITTVFMEALDWSLNGMVKVELYGLAPIVMLTWSMSVIFSYFVDKLLNYMPKKKTIQEEIDKQQLVKNECIMRTSRAFKNLASEIKKMSGIDYDYNVSVEGIVSREIAQSACRGCENGQIQYLERAKINYLWYNKMLETREAMAVQFNEMAKLMENYTKPIYEEKRALFGMDDYIKHKLREQKIVARKIFINENSKGMLEVRLYAKKRKKSNIPADIIKSVISEAVGKKVRLSEECLLDVTEEYNEYVLFEEVNFMTISGTARQTKGSEDYSGDNFAVMSLDSGQTFMSICDGMGSGKRAKKYSEIVIDLLEKMIDSGFEESTILKLANSIMLTGNQWQEPATVDMALIDQYSGICQFLKLGAACTYIKRGNWVECIKSTSLPMGVLEEVDMETITKKLYDGDFVIMVSDGIVDALDCPDKEEAMGRIIMDIHTANPKQMAISVLSQALAKCKGVPEDDMTVICTGIWEKV
ncbi:MAG: SpoIIE family protein phosphatase [Eubacterium sp.]|jgi:stage II sporulation protein E|nr:SpoIIE family protein phosphatase [Eubacterium sp.]MCI9617558.1 SpoIIE family protein phosphatase [Eubacterium sp.]